MKYFDPIIYILLVCFSHAAYAKTWHVGPNLQYNYCSEVASLVNDFDSVVIHNNLYKNDKQVTWTKNNLTIIGLNKPILEAGVLIENDQSNGKGIFVVRGQNIVIESIEFRNAKVPDRNGAGIRQEGCNLILRNCNFTSNEMGILCGTIPNCKTTIEFCIFKGNGSTFNPGYQHNVYINNIDTLIFQYNVSLDAVAEGHELKSRAKFNYIAYNWIANIESEDSRTIDLPNGGIAILIGNVILQGPQSANNNIIGYGLEGLTNSGPHNLILVNNTIVNKKDKGSFIHIPDIGCDSLIMYNNIIGGKQTSGMLIGNPTVTIKENNIENIELDNFKFVDWEKDDYRITPFSPCYNTGYNVITKIGNYSLKASKEFADGPDYKPRFIDQSIDIGAFELALTQTVDVTKAKSFFWPNPFSNSLTFQSMKNECLKVYNIYGREMLVDRNTAIVNTSDWPLGIYIVSDGFYSQKLVKHE